MNRANRLPATMLFVSASCALALLSASARAQATDLVGRNGQFTVKDSTGKVETVKSNDLGMQKELMPSAPRAAITNAEGETDGKDEKTGAKTADAKSKAANTAKAAGPKEETPEQKAIRAADVEDLRALRKLGGAYFYTEDNQPVSYEEVDRRIASGEVEGLKVVGLHLQDWKPKTKSKDAAANTSTDTSEPERSIPPILVPNLPNQKEKKKY